jgi:tripartite-type tricarboxylate transporter receptor subunit TctC
VWAPKDTPKEIIAKLNAAIAGALADPTVQKRLADIGQELPTKGQMTPDGFGAFQKAEMDKWAAGHQGRQHQAGRPVS